MTTPLNIENKTVLEVTSIHRNTAQEVVEITTDRLRLVLVEHKQGFERKKEWQTPLGIIVTITLVLVTTDFRKTWGLESSFWQALFVMLLIASGYWFLKAGYIGLTSPSISDVIEKIKKPD